MCVLIWFKIGLERQDQMINVLTYPALQALTHVGRKRQSFGNVRQDMNVYLKVLFKSRPSNKVLLCYKSQRCRKNFRGGDGDWMEQVMSLTKL